MRVYASPSWVGKLGIRWHISVHGYCPALMMEPESSLANGDGQRPYNQGKSPQGPSGHLPIESAVTWEFGNEPHLTGFVA